MTRATQGRVKESGERGAGEDWEPESRTSEKPVAVKAFRFHLKETKNANELKYRRCKHNSKQQFGLLLFLLFPPPPSLFFRSLSVCPQHFNGAASGCGFTHGPQLVAAAEKWSELRQGCQLVKFLKYCSLAPQLSQSLEENV